MVMDKITRYNLPKESKPRESSTYIGGQNLIESESEVVEV